MFQFWLHSKRALRKEPQKKKRKYKNSSIFEIELAMSQQIEQIKDILYIEYFSRKFECDDFMSLCDDFLGLSQMVQRWIGQIYWVLAAGPFNIGHWSYINSFRFHSPISIYIHVYMYENVSEFKSPKQNKRAKSKRNQFRIWTTIYGIWILYIVIWNVNDDLIEW